MSKFSFKLPDLGEGIVESEVSHWHVAVGDVVVEDQPLADVQTDKAVVEVTTPVAGVVLSLGCEAGDVLPVGAELASFETDASADGAALHSSASDESSDGDKSPSASSQASASPLASAATGAHFTTRTPATDPVFTTVLASPSLRKRAREAGINLADVPGSGPQGRISHQDFDAFVAAGGQLVSREVPKRTAVRETRLTGMRRVIARKMLESKRNIPHYSYVEEVDVTQLEALRKHLNTERNPEQPKLTLLPFLALAMVKVLPKFPHCNARYDSDSEMLSEYEAVHLGIATMTDSGLVVPVVRNCEALDVWQLAAEIARSAGNARDGKAKPDQLSGSTITITSLGAIGGVSTTPVINAPETSIIGVNKMVDRPVVRDGQIVVRTMMNLSASFDHRIVDGYDGAQLVQALRALLENPGAIFV